MQTIKRDIYVTKNVLQAPIEVTEGTNSIAIEFDVRDYDIPASAAAVVYSMCTSTMAEPNKALAEVDGNTITIIPSESFFHAGQNVMQIRVIDGDSKLISFNIIVKCTGKMRFGDEEEEKQTTLIEQILVKLGGYIEKLRNVRAVFFGDSTTWGESGNTDGVQVDKPYPTVFGEITGATVINCAVRGACGSSAKTNNFAEQITANAASIKSANKIFINFGINDFSQGINVGNASMTDSYYYGIYNGIATIQKSNPKADIIIILPTVGKGYLTNAAWRNSNGIGFDDYINALIDIGTKLHLKIVDFRNIGITKNNAATYYPTGYNHLTQDGYTLLGEHLARCYESNIYYGDVEEKSVAMNVLPHLLFTSPIEASSLNSFYNGIYWKLSGTDDKGLTSYKQFDIQT